MLPRLEMLQQPEMKNPTIVVVTDRTDLDGQLYQTFSAAQDLLKQKPIQADSREDLKMVIVCDMWVTGFDVPPCHTMYVDKPMKAPT